MKECECTRDKVTSQIRGSWATLTFPLPEEEEAFKRAARALDVFLFIWDFDTDVLRQATKYGFFDNTQLTEEECEVFQKVRDKFWEMWSERGLASLDEYIS